MITLTLLAMSTLAIVIFLAMIFAVFFVIDWIVFTLIMMGLAKAFRRKRC